MYSLTNKRVFVAGHRGMVGAALIRRLASEGCKILTASRQELDLKDQAATRAWFARERPDAVFLAAAKVGGILANNTLRAEFLYDNLIIAANVIHAAHQVGVSKLMFLGSTCIYPRLAPQPLTEDSLLTGPLEQTNEPYAIAKIAGIKLCETYRAQYGSDFISVMPTNLYGPGDNYDPEHSHVVASLIRRFHEAKLADAPEVIVWGTGTPRREFLHVDDMADACVYAMQHYSGPDILNIGIGNDIPIADFARLVAKVVGYKGQIAFDTNRPDGTPRKLVDVSRMKELGWVARIGLEEGLAMAYASYLEDIATLPRKHQHQPDTKVDYRDIVTHYERCLAQHGNGVKAVDWKDENSATLRYDVMLDMIGSQQDASSVLDFGCGLAGLRERMEARGMGDIAYRGLEISNDFASAAQMRRPDLDILTRDVLIDGTGGLEADFVIMNGIFTRRETLSVEEMMAYMRRLVGIMFPVARIGLAFNVMSHMVDWKSDTLFHPDTTALVEWLSRDISKHVTLRNDYGLHETTVYVYKQPYIAPLKDKSLLKSQKQAGYTP